MHDSIWIPLFVSIQSKKLVTLAKPAGYPNWQPADETNDTTPI
jgi:hypothetical protein